MLKVLFGTMENDDLNSIDGKLGRLSDFASQFDEQLTIVKDINAHIVSNTHNIQKVMTTLINYRSTFYSSIEELASRLKNSRNMLLVYLKLNTAFRQLEQTVTNSKIKIIEFRQALQYTHTRKISYKLLPPDTFLTILKEIEHNLPSYIHLPFEAEQSNLHYFYDVARVQSYARGHILKLIVQIPLGTPTDIFEHYRVWTYPVYDNNTQHWLKWKVQYNHLLINTGRQNLVEMSDIQINKCKMGPMSICELDSRIKRDVKSSCMGQLFQGIETSSCDRKIYSKLQ